MKLDQVGIIDVWHALGGGELRGKRGQAFWRGGDGLNVHIDVDRNSWHDYVNGTGGHALGLVMTVNGCDKKAALKWLQENAGLDRASGKAAIPKNDYRAARWWAITVEMLSDATLESMDPADPGRMAITEIRRIARAGGSALLDEYRAWHAKWPGFTAGMVHAGREHEKRIARQLAIYIEEMSNVA